VKSFRPGFLAEQRLTHSLLSTVRLVGEYKGKQDLFKKQVPEALETMRRTAIIESAVSSNRIEGVIAADDRIEHILANGPHLRDRSEQEIAGYRDVLNTIHTDYQHMPFTPSLVLQLHRDLYKFTASPGGRWKDSDNEISELLPDGTRRTRFKAVPAYQTRDYMEHLHGQFNAFWANGQVEQLLLIGAYVLDFLCIHPFTDGNGRLGRLISLLLLYRAGYEVGRYISLERIIEETRESYYGALAKSSVDWHEGRHSLLPWWEYFTGAGSSAMRRSRNPVRASADPQ
jgi:Fic family protein